MIDRTAEQAFQALRMTGKTVTTAESCTGGLIAARLTAIPGSSAVFPGGFVVYSDFAKHEQLGISEELLSTVGAVSEEVACELAAQSRRKMNTDFGIGVTGLAGPDSDGSGKPVGLIYVALAGDSGTRVATLHLSADRTENRKTAADTAFAMLLEALSV